MSDVDKQNIPNGVYVDIEKMEIIEGQKDYLKELEENGFDTLLAFFMPKDRGDKFRALSQVLKSLLDSSNMGKSLGIKNEELIVDIKRIAESLCYLINCNSIDTDKYQDYDKRTVDVRLGRNQ